MAKILITWELGSGLGHLHSIAAIAEELNSRGNHVTLATKDLPKTEQLLRHLPVSIRQAPRQPQSRHPPKSLATFAQVLQATCFNNLEALQTVAEQWRLLFAETRPDLILFDHSPTALLASRGISVRRAVVGNGFYCPADVSSLPNWREWQHQPNQQRQNDEQATLATINSYLASQQLKPLNRVTQLYAEVDETILETYPELDPFPDRANAVYRGIGPANYGTVVPWPQASGKKVFGYLRPCPVIPALFAALEQLDASGVFYLPAANTQRWDDFANANLKIVTQPVNLAEISKECDCFVGYGSHWTTATMLLAGCAVLSLPFVLEQLLTAKQVATLGAGLVALPHDEANAKQCLHQLLTEERFSSAAQDFANRYAATDRMNHVAHIVDRLEMILNRQPKSNR